MWKLYSNVDIERPTISKDYSPRSRTESIRVTTTSAPLIWFDLSLLNLTHKSCVLAICYARMHANFYIFSVCKYSTCCIAWTVQLKSWTPSSTASWYWRVRHRAPEIGIHLLPKQVLPQPRHPFHFSHHQQQRLHFTHHRKPPGRFQQRRSWTTMVAPPSTKVMENRIKLGTFLCMCPVLLTGSHS